MRRIIAIIRCIYHAFLPPCVEKWRTGRVHYYPESNYWYHMFLNLRAALKLLFFVPMSPGSRKFHNLD